MRNLLATLPSRAAKGVFVGLLLLTLSAFALAQSVYYSPLLVGEGLGVRVL